MGTYYGDFWYFGEALRIRLDDKALKQSRNNIVFSISTDRLDELDALWEVAHEGECTDSLGQAGDLAKAYHKAVLLGELVQGPPVSLVVLDELDFVL